MSEVGELIDRARVCEQIPPSSPFYVVSLDAPCWGCGEPMRDHPTFAEWQATHKEEAT